MRLSARAWLGPASALASGALYAHCFPPTRPGLGSALAWVALVPFFRALRGRGPAAAAGLAALFAFAATASVVRWIVPTLHGHFEWSAAASAAFLIGLAGATAVPFFAFTYGLAHLGGRPLGGVRQCLLLAAAFVAAELLRSHFGLRSPWATLGVTQIDSGRLRQVADLTGVYGVSGLVAFGNAAFAALLVRRPRLTSLGPAAVACGLVLAALLYGEARTRDFAGAEARGPNLDVLLVQGNIPPELRWKRNQAARVLRRYDALTRDALTGSPDRPDLVVWPENAIQTTLDDASYGPPVFALARAVPLLLGAPRQEHDELGRRAFNSAHWIGEDGHVASYDKRRLLPFSEARPWGDAFAIDTAGDLDGAEWTAGQRPGLFSLDGHGVGVLICLEALYPELAREAVAEGADVLVNLSNDGWFVGPGAQEQHFAHVAYRAIETRRPLLRVTPTGITAIVSPLGDVSARLEPGTRGVLRAEVPWPIGPPSLYARAGDVFAVACLLICAAPLARRGLDGAAAHIRAGLGATESGRRIA